MKLITSGGMRNLEKICFDEFGIPSVILMENAAHGFFRVLKEECKSLCGKKTAVFCGKGNNGGDGFAIARYLKNEGADVTVFLLFEEEKISGDALTNYEIIKKMGVKIQKDCNFNENFDIIVDAIFGTGFCGEVKEAEMNVICAINKSGARIFSVDIPSGGIADSGAIGGICVKAEQTITFGVAKAGLFLYPLKEYAGKVTVCDISIPKMLIDDYDTKTHLLDRDILKLMPERKANTHKGSYGRVLAVCGSYGMTGACEMAATAAAKSGAGLVTAAVPENVFNILASKFTEVMTVALNDDADEAAKMLLSMAKDVLLIGCGISRSEFAKKLTLKLLAECDFPVVLDADGINAVNGNINVLKERTAPTVITPHIAEIARLLEISTEDVLKNRMSLCGEFSKNYGCILVLKSADTVIASPNGEIYVTDGGNSGLAKGGSGDVLAGLCASMLAQKLTPFQASLTAVYLHSRAGCYARDELGEYVMSPTDIIKYLPKAFSEKQE